MKTLLRTRVKFCGLTRASDVLAAVELGVDAVGFVFYEKSARAITIAQAQYLAKYIPPYISIVGLFVNASKKTIAEVLNNVPVTHLQFHGDETSQACFDLAAFFQRPWTKALRLNTTMTVQDVQALMDGAPINAHYLLDSWSQSYGGTGKVFDWSIIPKAARSHIILSGGLDPSNIKQAIEMIHPYAVDVSSGIEKAGEKGIKDPLKMKAFMQAVYLADQGRLCNG